MLKLRLSSYFAYKVSDNSGIELTRRCKPYTFSGLKFGSAVGAVPVLWDFMMLSMCMVLALRALAG